MAEVALEGITKRFAASDARAAVADVSLTVPDGNFCVLVGPSGCGKSTTLRIIAGLETPTSGSVRIGGEEVTRKAPADRDIAMVFQSYALYPHMTVRENLGFGLKMRRAPRAEIDARVAEAAEMLSIAPLLERRPGQLSGGQRQRVAMGRALVRRPAVFLFDEPLSNLDARLRLEVRHELARLHHRLGATMIYVTHDQAEAMTLADVMVVMKDGLAVQVGKPLDVYRTPATRFVAEFLGTPPMSFLAGRAIAGLAVAEDALVGVRPEDVSLRRRTAGEAEVRGLVELCEPLGGETLVTLSCEGGSLVARLGPEEPIPAYGQPCAAYLEPARAHLFDAKTGARLSRTEHAPAA